MKLFNKKEYWENRKRGKRGQGTPFNSVGVIYPPETWKEVKRIMKEEEAQKA